MAQPKIGLSMLYCLGKSFNEMTEHLAKVQTNYIEIVDDGSHSLNKQRVSMLKDIGASYSLKYSVHAPFADINIASLSEAMLGAVFNRLEESIEHANALDAYEWVFHPGLRSAVSMFYPNADWIQNRETAQSLSKVAEDCGVKIAIENVPEPYPFLMKGVKDFQRFYSETDADIGIVLDIGHANINGQTENFLTTFADTIVHIHASDNDGSGDQHLGVGHGTVDWKNIADILKKNSYNETIVVESIEYVEESVRKLKQLLI